MTDAVLLQPPPARSLEGRGSRWKRNADYWIGIPLVWLLGLFRRAREVPRQPRRIALLKTAAIGDMVLMSGPLRDLRAAFPDARITLLCGPSNAGMGALMEGADEVVQLPIGKPLKALRAIGRRRFDLIIDFGAWPRLDALYTLLARGAYRIGFAKDGQHRHHLFHGAVVHDAARHELDNYRALLAAAGVASASPPALSAAAPLAADLRLALQGRPCVVFHLWPGGSNAPAREWPLERWAQLAAALIARGYRILLTGGPSDRVHNDSLIRLLGEEGPRQVINVAGRSLAQTTAVLAQAACTVSVNTGVMHIAAALGVPLIGLHGATAVRRWGPVGPRAQAIASTLPGCGCLDLGFEPMEREDCTHSITVEQVLAAVEAQIAGSTTPAPAPAPAPAVAPGVPASSYNVFPSPEQLSVAPTTVRSVGRPQAALE